MEGIILIVITMLSPVIGGALGLLGLLFSQKNWKINIFCLSMFFANLAYCYTPENAQPDLFRYFEYIVDLRGHTLIDTIQQSYEGANLYVFNFFVWASNIFKDEHLVPMFSVFCVYFIAFYVTCHIGISKNYTWKYVRGYLFVVMLMLDWYSITNNVRNISAFAVIGFAIFRDVYMKKRDLLTIICYVAPIFVHPTALLFLAVRMIVLFVRSDKMRILLIFATVMISPIVGWLNDNLMAFASNPTIYFVISKAHSYLFDTSSSYGLRVQTSSRSLVARILYLSFTAVICLMEIYMLKIRTKKMIETDKKGRAQAAFNTYVLIVGMMALSCFSMLRPEYWRFSATLIVFGGSIAIPFWQYNAKTMTYKLLKYFLIALIPGCAAIWMYQMTWLDAPQLFTEMLINSPLWFLVNQVVSFFGVSML